MISKQARDLADKYPRFLYFTAGELFINSKRSFVETKISNTQQTVGWVNKNIVDKRKIKYIAKEHQKDFNN